jgi:CRISPR/Cas system CMR-associated protein Cmr1 (group 7 of RAMP superfamily)
MKEKIQKFVNKINEKVQTKLSDGDRKFVGTEFPLKFVDLGDSYEIRMYSMVDFHGIDSYSISKAIDQLFSGGRGSKYWLEVDDGIDNKVSKYSPLRNYKSFIFGTY